MVKTNATAARAMKIAEIKRQIAAGVYETAEKIDHALDAFLDSKDASPAHEKRVPRKRPK